MEAISREKAKERGLKRYFTGKPCKHGHISERKVSNSGCLECKRLSDIQYNSINHDKEKERRRRYRENNREALRERGRQYYRNTLAHQAERKKKYYRENRKVVLERKRRWKSRNPEASKAYDRRYYLENRDRIREYYQNDYLENRHKYIAWDAKRRAAELQRTLRLPHLEYATLRIYERCRDMRDSGFDVHVDHIVPLQGELVSGLHVPWNLEIIDADENRAKGNRFNPYVEHH